MITFDNLTWDLPDGERLFGPLNGTIGAGLTGLVGPNGSGKSTLASLIEGRTTPSSGVVRRDADIGFLAQRIGADPSETVAGALGVAGALAAIAAATEGRLDPACWDEVDWSARTTLERALARVGLEHLAPDTRTASLSGGQRVRLALAAALRGEPAMLVLDEPTNDLDAEGRALVGAILDARRDAGSGALVISHDRTLLRAMDGIVELTRGGLRRYGGGWDFYTAAREGEDRVADERLAAARRDVADTRRRAQRAHERKQRRESVGRRQSDKGVNSRVSLNAGKERSERSRGSGARLAERLAATATDRLADARSGVRERVTLATRLSTTGLHATRSVLAFEAVTAAHGAADPVFEDLSFEIVGPERVAVTGPNGAGKSTLMRLASGDLEPVRGRVHRPVPSVLLDQEVTLLHPDVGVLANFLRLNAGDDETACRNVLAHFLFPSDAVHRPIRDLSGGETLRAALCCVLGGTCVPPLLLLDEPTNHLDVDAIEAIERGLVDYDGALIVISHDPSFIASLGLERHLELPAAAARPPSLER